MLAVRRSSVARRFGAILGLGLGVALLFGLAPSGVAISDAAAQAAKPKSKGKSKKKAKGGVNDTMSDLLLKKSDEVQDCAVKMALNKGANKVEVDTKVTINGRGQVVDIQTSVVIDKGDNKPLHECVDALIRSIKFPASEAPLVTIARSWTIANS